MGEGTGRRLVIEADGGSRGNPGPAGYGAVVRDDATGEVLTETAEYIGTATNNVAEYRGLIAGLRAARAIDPKASVRVRMDSRLVVEQMSGRWKIKHPAMRPLALAAGGIFPPGAVHYEWIPRERNRHADRLANEAMDAGKNGEPWRPAAASGAGADAKSGAASGAASGARPNARPGAGPGGVEGDPQAEAFAATRRQATAPAQAAPVGWGTVTGAATTFLLLRHGSTALTPQKRFSGSGGGDPELSETGRRQAAQAAAALVGVTIDAVVSSPLARCRQTAQAVAARLGGMPVRYDEAWRETDFGAWEGLTFAEVQERHPQDLTAWLASPEAAPTGGGESFSSVTRRTALARDKAIARHPGRTLLVVSHVSPIKCMLRLALGAPPEVVFRMELAPAALSEIAYYPDGNAMVRRFNVFPPPPWAA